MTTSMVPCHSWPGDERLLVQIGTEGVPPGDPEEDCRMRGCTEEGIWRDAGGKRETERKEVAVVFHAGWKGCVPIEYSSRMGS